MTKFRILSLIFAFIAASAWSQTYGTGDAQLDGFLVDMNASAKLDLPGFYAEVNFDWGIPVATLKAAGASLDPAGIYMAAAIAALGKQPFETVVSTYKANAAKGWPLSRSRWESSRAPRSSSN